MGVDRVWGLRVACSRVALFSTAALGLLGLGCGATDALGGSGSLDSGSNEGTTPGGAVVGGNGNTASGGTSATGGLASPVAGGDMTATTPSIPPGLTPNGDGTFTDTQGTIVIRASDGTFVDQSGNPVTIDANGRAVPLNPELELESSFRVPVVTGQFVWTANPESGRVAVVDVVTREVETLPAGLQPTYLAALPGGVHADRAIVINTGSLDATLYREDPSGAFAQTEIPVHAGANAWAVSAGGRWAIAWSDERQLSNLDDTEGLQDVTVIDLSLEDPTLSTRLSVGYRPKQIAINAAESRAYAVTEDGISVIELGDLPELGTDITILTGEEAISGDGGSPVLEDVPVTPDGNFALVRFAGAARLKVISLADDTSQIIELPGEVSDIDLTGGGTRALAVIRETSQIALFDLDAILADNTDFTLRTFPDETIGSAAVPETSDFAVLFTTAINSDRVTIVDTSLGLEDSGRTVELKAPVTAVFPAPDGSHAIALLRTDASSERAGAFSVIPMAQALPPKIQGTDARPLTVSISETAAGLRGLVTVRDDENAIFATYLIQMPSLQVDRIPLSSPPLATGIVPEQGIGYVAQIHPEGRITFVDFASGNPETLTGFELAGRVVTGSSSP